MCWECHGHHRQNDAKFSLSVQRPFNGQLYLAPFQDYPFPAQRGFLLLLLFCFCFVSFICWIQVYILSVKHSFN